MKAAMTNALRELDQFDVQYTSHAFDYQERGGTRQSSQELGADEHAVIKTLVFELEDKSPLIALMHGDRQVSTKQLARALDVKTISPCAPAQAEKHTGYQVGGISPYGTRKKLPIYLQKTILEISKIFINGGRRGFLVSFESAELMRTLQPTLVDVAIGKGT